jgi:DNA-binding transcriptional regulator YdaS (Cro superfamily)
MEKENISAVSKAAELTGGISSLAILCDVSPPAVFKWLKKGKAPADRCLQSHSIRVAP